MQSETFVVEINWETHKPGDVIHRVIISEMQEDDTIIIEGIQPDEMERRAIEESKGSWYTLEKPFTLYQFRVPYAGASRSDWATALYEDLGAAEMFGGAAYDQIRAMLLELFPNHPYGAVMTLWEMYYFSNDDDWDNEWFLIGAVNPLLLSQCLYRTGDRE